MASVDQTYVNPRAENQHGQVVELIPPGGVGPGADPAADEVAWEMFRIAGGPAKERSRAIYHPQTPDWISPLNNCAFDVAGRLWISTKGRARVRTTSRTACTAATSPATAGLSRVLLRLPAPCRDGRTGVSAPRPHAPRRPQHPGEAEIKQSVG